MNHALAGDLSDRCGDADCETPAASGIESISNDTNGWKLRLELPGYNKDEVKLSVDANFLNIVAETEVPGNSAPGESRAENHPSRVKNPRLACACHKRSASRSGPSAPAGGKPHRSLHRKRDRPAHAGGGRMIPSGPRSWKPHPTH